MAELCESCDIFWCRNKTQEFKIWITEHLKVSESCIWNLNTEIPKKFMGLWWTLFLGRLKLIFLPSSSTIPLTDKQFSFTPFRYSTSLMILSFSSSSPSCFNFCSAFLIRISIVPQLLETFISTFLLARSLSIESSFFRDAFDDDNNDR